MNNMSLTEKLKHIALGTAVAFTAGCYTPQKAPEFTVKNNISGITKSRMTQDDAPFNYQTLTIAGVPYEIERATRRALDEEDFILRPDMDSTMWRGLNRTNKREAWLTSEEIAVPKKLYVSKRDESGNEVKEGDKVIMVPAREVDFEVTGPYALRAEVIRPEIEDLAVSSITEQLEKYGIETRGINNRPYAVAIKTDKKTGKIDQVLLIRTGENDVDLGTRRRDGMITLRSPDDIYELVKVKQLDYDKREGYTNLGTSGPTLTPEVKAAR